MHELTIVVPIGWWMSANHRLHWTQRRARTANLRTFTLAAAQRARLPKGLGRVRIVAHVSWPTRRRHDVHNAMPTVKPIVDGLVDYGLIADDDTAHLIGPDLRDGPVTPMQYTVRLVIEEVR